MELHESIWKEVTASAEKAFVANFDGFPEELTASLPEFNLLIEWHKQSLISAVASLSCRKHIKRYLKKHLRQLIEQHFAELFDDLKARTQARQEKERAERTQKLLDEIGKAKSELELLSSIIDLDCYSLQEWYRRGYPEIQQDRPPYKHFWMGIGIIICSPQSGEEEYTGGKTLCVTPYARNLSALCLAMFKSSTECLDYISKYLFLGSIAESINTEKPDTEKGVLLCAVSSALEVLKELEASALNPYRRNLEIQEVR